MDDLRLHEVTGQGFVLYCPLIFGAATESCTCETPCPEAYDAVVVVESYPRPHRAKVIDLKEYRERRADARRRR